MRHSCSLTEIVWAHLSTDKNPARRTSEKKRKIETLSLSGEVRLVQSREFAGEACKKEREKNPCANQWVIEQGMADLSY